MTLTTSPADALSPLRLPPDLRLTPEQFELVCAETGLRNGELVFQLQLYAKRSGGWKVFDSSAGFRLPDGSVVSPDASLIRLDRWQALSPDEQRRFAPLCPDLVVELASPSDERPRGVTALRQKMAAYQATGAPQRLAPVELLQATPEFPGLQLQLAEIWSV